MKKIFAIALALVMVLSMASAFALTCNTNYDWSCATTTYTCGKIKFEVVPFVRSSTACANESDFIQSSCAAAVVGERVYYGIKMTVDKDLDKEWYDSIKKVTVKQTNLAANENGAKQEAWEITMPTFAEVDNGGKGGVYWHVAGTNIGAWTKDADFSNANVEAKWVLKNNVKVCIDGDALNEFRGADVGGYKVQYDAGKNTLTFIKKDNKAVVYLNGDDKVQKIEVTLNYKDANAKMITFVADNGSAFVAGKDHDGDLYGYACTEGAFLKGIVDFFKFNFGTCMTKKAINANFGWNDELDTCFTWNKNGTAVVNPECQVAIPKTGDVSVVAYAVMALVAAAGAMGLKK